MKQDGGEDDICPFLHLHLFKDTLFTLNLSELLIYYHF